MDTKKIFQYSLLIILFVVSFLFYYKYFFKDDNKAELNKSENIIKKKDQEVNQNDENKTMQDQEAIYIYSKTANYNKINNNTVFRRNVNVKYGDQTIDSETLNLNFEDNLIEILDNVYYVNKNTKISADKVEIDLLYKKLKISMINENNKVSITSKY